MNESIPIFVAEHGLGPKRKLTVCFENKLLEGIAMCTKI
jgi:hypothetical protein